MATLKQLEEKVKELSLKLEMEVNRVSGEVKTYVKSKGRTWLIIAGVLLVAVIILVFIVFKKNKPIDESYKQKIDQLDSTLKYQERYIEALQSGQQQRDSIISDQIERIKNNRPSQTKIIHEIERIPTDVNSLNRDELRRQVTNF